MSISDDPKNVLKSDDNLSLRKRILFWLIACLCSFFIIEAAIRIADIFLRSPGPKAVEDLSIYSDHDMARQLHREDNENEGKILLPFSGWAHRPFDGKYVHVLANSERRTWNPERDSRKTFKIFVFGGSTVWGTGVQDDGTIPSQMSKLLNETISPNVRTLVRNFGETSYSLVQIATRLLVLLQKGEVPDLVVFYGGFNETNFAYETGLGGIAGDEQYISNIYRDRIYQGAFRQAANEFREKFGSFCRSCQVALGGLRHVWPGLLIAPAAREIGFQLAAEELDHLAEETANDYQNEFPNYLNGLADGFHFRAVIFWQPNLYTESKRIGEENLLEHFYPHSNDVKAAELFKKTYARIHDDSNRNFFNISDTLQSRSKECYLDAVHISEECNGIVSRRIVEILRAQYLQ